ncbi:hypothetical protein [Streptomyces sp. NPDC058664]|uniref:hypothetical protein n=1 Tax=unclassified Streptomyces TaxID=2593676 RepID=UPI0036542938
MARPLNGLGAGDADRDGRPHLYATASDGGDSAVLHRGTGSWTQPFRTAEAVGVSPWREDLAYNARP